MSSKEQDPTQFFSPNNFRLLIEKNADGIIIVNASGEIRFINPAGALLLGRSINELVGQVFGFPIDAQETTEFSLILKNQELISVEMRVVEIEWENQKAYLASLRNITEKKLMRQVRAHLAAIVDFSQDAIFSKDLEGKILSWNKGAERLYGYTSQEILNKSASILFPNEKKGEFDFFMKTLSAGENIQEVETVRVRKDGTPVNVALTISCLRDEAGNVIGASSIVRDITKLKMAEKSMRESAKKLEEITAAIPGVVYQFKADKNKNYSFPFISKGIEELYEIQPAEVYENSNKLFEFILEETKPSLFQSIEESRENLSPWRYDFQIKTKSGKMKWLRGHSLPQLLSDQSMLWNGVLTDITELKKTESQLAQAQKMEVVGSLAGGIAHDLNNQLTPVSGYIDLILKETNPNHPNYQYLSEANNAVRRATEIVRRLVAFSRPSTQKRSAVLLNLLLPELKNLLARVFPSNISVEIDCPKDIWPIKGNDTELETVLMNLATNARDAMKSAGKLSIVARNLQVDQSPVLGLRGPLITLTVTDTGIGMPPSVLRRIFEPFFTTKDVGSGTGLGLAMAFRIVKDHGGVIDVSSQVGKGTTFTIYLPASPGLTHQEQSISEVKRKFSKGNETILFVDDVDTLRDLGRLFLEGLGYKVLFAKDAEEAIKTYGDNAKEISLVILDMTIPKMTGRQTLRKILDINKEAKVLLVSGFTSEATGPELIAEGAKGFLEKPYTIGPLSYKIREILDSK